MQKVQIGWDLEIILSKKKYYYTIYNYQTTEIIYHQYKYNFRNTKFFLQKYYDFNKRYSRRIYRNLWFLKKMLLLSYNSEK